MERRQFLSVIVKAVGLTGLVKSYGFEGAVAWAEDKAKVTPSPSQGVWTSKQPVLNTNSNVIHWPNPGLYKADDYRVAPQNSRTIDTDEWEKYIEGDSKYRFDKRRSGVIYENLALREIVTEDESAGTFDKDSLNKSIEVLTVAVSDLSQSRNWRLYDLLERLISLKHEDSPEKARIEFIEVMKALKASPAWKTRDPLSRANDSGKFSKWHAKTVDKQYAQYRKQLIIRVKSENGLV